MPVEAVGLSALLIKWGGWFLTGVGSLLLAALGYTVKEKNALIQSNQQAINDMNLHMRSLESLVRGRDQAIDELSLQLNKITEMREQVIIMDVQISSIRTGLNDIKEDQKELAKELRNYLSHPRGN